MRRLALLLLACALVAACGSEPAPSPGTPPAQPAGADDFPASINAANGRVVLRARPQRVVSLSPTATEMLFAVDAGDQVVAVDDNSDYPAGAPPTKLSGYEPNLKAIREL